jgi:hypothetical protein
MCADRSASLNKTYCFDAGNLASWQEARKLDMPYKVFRKIYTGRTMGGLFHHLPDGESVAKGLGRHILNSFGPTHARGMSLKRPFLCILPVK